MDAQSTTELEMMDEVASTADEEAAESADIEKMEDLDATDSDANFIIMSSISIKDVAGH